MIPSPLKAMEIREDRRDGITVVAPVGRLDINTCGELEASLLRHLGAGESRLVVDMAGLDYVSSAGLRVILMLAKKLDAQGGRLVLCSLVHAVREVFELSGLTQVFAIETSREAAVARIAAE